MPATQPVWLDCDPGHDDMCAIILAGHHDALSLLGISTVSGNQSLDKTTLNAAKVLVIAGLEHVSVTPGQARPILSLPFHDAEIHGKTGLDGTDLLPSADEVPAGIVRRDDKGVLAMARAIMASERPVSLVATGALTNVALMLQLFPEAKPHIREVVLMGGAVGVGNRGSVMEFNILCDPEAAAVVFESGLKVVMVPLEVTHTALITEAVLEEIRALGTFGTCVSQLLTFFKETYARVFNMPDPPLHDPCAVAWVIAPELFETELMRVDVECGSALSRGQTVCDVWHYSTKPKNVHVAKAMDVPAFWKLMLAALRRAKECSSLK